ncbi:hypothetical protein WISP_06071 [Willisornis vidua]|uniref:Uncharacterized protein n=1 Tax=Willisornis vidua TaxID=1566151 RepID=A0ABQ9DT04_9PASS|nr:hypothetical protein WISP_06071 [Willisornis vidua]
MYNLGGLGPLVRSRGGLEPQQEETTTLGQTATVICTNRFASFYFGLSEPRPDYGICKVHAPVQDWRISEGNISTKQSDLEHWKASRRPLNAEEEEVDEEGGLITPSPNSTGDGDWERTEVELDMCKVVIG